MIIFSYKSLSSDTILVISVICTLVHNLEDKIISQPLDSFPVDCVHLWPNLLWFGHKASRADTIEL